MLTNHKIIISLMLIGSLSGSILAMHKTKVRVNYENPGCCAMLKQQWQKSSWPMRGLVIGSSCALIGGTAALLYHLMTREESSAKLHMQCQITYEEMAHKYRPGLSLLQSNQLDSIDAEAELASLAPRVSRLTFSSISNDVRLLQTKKDILQRRISRDAHTGDALIAHMIKLLQNIKKLISDLDRLNEFWQRHGDYFVAYSTIAQLATRYKQVRENVHDYNQIKKVIMSLAVGGWAQYPYLSFADALKNDLDELNRRIQTIQYYPVLRGMALPFQEELQKLLGNVVAFPEYANELYLKKQHQLEQERIAIERQKMEAERAKAQAMAAQAAAEKAKADAMYQQAAAAREQAQAIKDQTLVQLAQPKPNININLQPPAQAAPSGNMQQTTHYIQPSVAQWSYDYQPSISNQNVSNNFTPEPSAPPLEVDAPPSYSATMFFRAIENITPSALTRLDFHISQLEQQYGLAKDVYMDNLSLISAALDAKNLDAFNKAQLIELLKGYGVEPTWADKQKARETGATLIMKAVGI